MLIAVKYCGGCNCSYDRSAMLGQLRSEFPAVNVVNAEDQGGEEPDLVLVICGCSSVCAAHSHLNGKHGKIITACEGDFAAVRQAVADFGNQNS